METVIFEIGVLCGLLSSLGAAAAGDWSRRTGGWNPEFMEKTVLWVLLFLLFVGFKCIP